MNLDCLECRTVFPPLEFLGRFERFRPNVRVLDWRCPRCGAQAEIRLVDDEVQRGYVYAAGEPHFSDEHHIPLPGLRAIPGAAGLLIEFGDRSWTVGTA